MPNEISNRVKIIDENNAKPIKLSEIAEMLELADDEEEDEGTLDEIDARPLTFSQIVEAMDGEGDPTDTDIDGDELNMAEKAMFYKTFAAPISEDTMANLIDNIDAGLEPDDYHEGGSSGGGSGEFPEDYDGDVDEEFINSLIDDDTSEGAVDD